MHRRGCWSARAQERAPETDLGVKVARSLDGLLLRAQHESLQPVGLLGSEEKESGEGRRNV